MEAGVNRFELMVKENEKEKRKNQVQSPMLILLIATLDLKIPEPKDYTS